VIAVVVAVIVESQEHIFLVVRSPHCMDGLTVLLWKNLCLEKKKKNLSFISKEYN
jgi:hypothetical protein